MTATLRSPPPLTSTFDDVLAGLDELVERGPLGVVFQPIVDLQRGEPLGYEVLGRCGPLTGALAGVARGPADLLDLAHRHGRLLALDRRWRELSVGQIAGMARDAKGLFFLNVDPRVTDYADHTPGFTLSLVERHGLAPERFVLELTEVACLDPAAVERVLDHYARQGFRVALDDLGAGQQSLVALLRVQPHIVKLDRELVRDVDIDPARAHLLDALAGFARRTGIWLVAEGIETQAQLQAVHDAGVPYAQGYLLGRPAASPEPLSNEAQDAIRSALALSTPRAAAPCFTGDPSAPLLRLVEGLRGSEDLAAMLRHVTSCAAELLGVERVSLRLLDESRSRLLVAARTGAPVHENGDPEFVVGEGLAGWVAAHGAPLRLDDAVADARFARKSGMTSAMGSFLGVPLLDSSGCIGVLATTSPERRAFSAAHERWLRLVAGLVAPYLDVARLNHLAITDTLTSALNRRALDSLLPRGGVISPEPLSVVLFDIDHFKSVNDRFGHAAGDAVLRALTQSFGAGLRRGDRVVRLGGEEFLLVLPGVTLGAACAIAERIREAIAAQDTAPGVRVTVSAGVAERAFGEDRDALLHRADAALYSAKERGRNCVVTFEDLPPASGPRAAAS